MPITLALRDWLRAKVRIELPFAFVEVLKMTAGLQLDSDCVSSAADCRWENDGLNCDPRYHRYVPIGREDNAACWAYAADSEKYLIFGFSDPDSAIESYDSFTDLLASRQVRGSG